MGIISAGKPLGQAIERLLKRTWVVYSTTLVLSFGFATLVMLTGLKLWEEGIVVITSYDEMLEMAVGILTMRHIAHGSDVLIVYVVYLGIAPLALWGLHKKRTDLVIGAMLGIYILSQLSLEMTALPFASFRHLAANNLIFFGGLVIGYHREIISEKWVTWRFSRYVDWLICGIGIFMLYLYTTDFKMLSELGKRFAEMEVLSSKMPPLNLVVVFIYIRIFWLMATYLWKPLHQIAGWLLIPFGQASLFTFAMHLCLIPIFRNTPKIFDHLDRLTATFWNAVLIAALYAAVKIRAWVLNVAAQRKRVVGYLTQNLPLMLAVIFMLAFVSLAAADFSPARDIATSQPEGVFAEVCRNLYEESGSSGDVFEDLCGDYIK